MRFAAALYYNAAAYGERQIMKIGVFGGTFNPIHNGHIYLCERFIGSLRLDKVLLIPAYIPPHKNAQMLARGEHRLNMCRLAVQDNPKFEASGIELKRKGKSYTYQTLQQLKKLYPKDELYLIMGSDMFLTVQDWVNPNIIFSLAAICTSARLQNEYEMLIEHKKILQRLGAQCVVENFDAIELSSTAVRQLIINGGDAGGLIPQSVLKYIEKYNLYKKL